MADRGSALSELVIDYTAERFRRGEFTKDTRRQVECVLLRFADAVGDPAARDLTARHIDVWLVSAGNLARSTARNRLSAIRRFCTWLIRKGVLKANPCDDAPRIRQPRHVPRALPAASVGDLYAALPDARAELIVSLMVQEGLRCREVAALELGDLDQAEGTMVVVGKGGHQRMLPISDETSRALRRYLLEHPASAGPLIRRYDRQAGLSAHYVSDLVRRWMSESGVKQRSLDGVGGHALRHTAATDVMRSTGNVVLVQQMLGHVQLSTTQIYLRTFPEDLRKAMEGRTYRRRPGTVTEITSKAAHTS